MDKTYFIAELGLCHNGNVSIAKEMIDVSIDAGANAVKLQKRDIDTLATNEELDKEIENYPSLGKTQREIRKKLELNKAEYKILREYCRGKIDFIVTPFDIESLNFLDDLDVDYIKVAAHNLTNTPLLEEIAKKGKPVILSTGMCYFKDIDRAINILKGNKLILLHCISQYPAEYKYMNLLMIKELINRYPKYDIGYSDHEDGITVAPVAVALGARIIEKHITLNKYMEGYDHSFSLNPHQLKECIRNIRNIELAMIKREKVPMENEMECFNLYRRSIVSNRFIEKGTTITKDMLCIKEPNKGLSPYMIDYVIGKKAKRDILEDSHITSTMII